MPQGVLPFQYAAERSSTGMTAMAGAGVYLDMMVAAGLWESVGRHVGIKRMSQGWTDIQMITSLVLLNVAGGESVSDLDVLEGDEGLGRLLRRMETHGMHRREREATERRWRVERQRSVPSASAMSRYLESFHDRAEEAKREPGRAFIPAASACLRGLSRVNADMVAFVQRHIRQSCATLDMDATLVKTHKQQAQYCYDKYKAYQPLTTYWHEAGLIAHTEFRDGNVPAGYQQKRVLTEALAQLPSGVNKVMLRSDTAGYQQELLRYCAKGQDARFGEIEFAVGVMITPEFRKAVAQTPEGEWRDLRCEAEGSMDAAGQQWAEVEFVPNWTAYSKKDPYYRFLAVREPMHRPPLPGMEIESDRASRFVDIQGEGWYKVSGVVTNRTIAGEELIRWYRERCGRGEQVHGVLKRDLAAGRLPSGLFGANAAWWSIATLAFNLNSAVKQLAMGGEWLNKRLKAVRFGVVNLPGRMVRHGRRLIIRLTGDHPSYDLLIGMRRSILALAADP